MLLILVEVPVKKVCWSTTVTDCSYKAITMQLILVEVATCESDLSVHDCHRLKAHSYLHVTYPGGSIYKSGLSVHDRHRLKAQSYLHATYSDGSISKWLVGPHSYRLQPQSHYYATYSDESICEKRLLVHRSHRLKAQSYLHATYLSRRVCKSGLSVHDIEDEKTHRINTVYLPGCSCSCINVSYRNQIYSSCTL